MTLVLLLAILGSPEGPSEPPPPDQTAECYAKASPEHKVAMLEACQWVPATDLGVARARTILSRVDVLYTEDAAKITALTELFWRHIREAGEDASAIEILDGATAWRGPAYFRDGKREFEEYIAVYSSLRTGRGKRPGLSHARAIAILKANAMYIAPPGK